MAAGLNHEAELVDTARPYRAAEAEIPRRFAARRPQRQDDVNYLKSAVCKDEDIDPMKAAIREVSLQRVRMRHAQFNAPLPWSDVEPIIAEPAQRRSAGQVA